MFVTIIQAANFSSLSSFSRADQALPTNSGNISEWASLIQNFTPVKAKAFIEGSNIIIKQFKQTLAILEAKMQKECDNLIKTYGMPDFESRSEQCVEKIKQIENQLAVNEGNYNAKIKQLFLHVCGLENVD